MRCSPCLSSEYYSKGPAEVIREEVGFFGNLHAALHKGFNHLSCFDGRQSDVSFSSFLPLGGLLQTAISGILTEPPGSYNSSWVQEELRSTGIESQDEDSPVQNDRTAIGESWGVNYKTDQEEDDPQEEEEEEGKEKDEDVVITHPKPDNGDNLQDPGEVLALVVQIKACIDKKDLYGGIGLHAQAIRSGLLETNVVLGNTIVNMYAKCGEMEKAQEVFDELPLRSSVSWNVLISGYAQNERGEEALYCFKSMENEGFFPNEVTFACILKACGNVGDLNKGQEIHAQMVREGYLETNVHIGTALLDMYAKCGLLLKAQEIFDRLPTRNIVSWTALIIGYVQDGYGEEALQCFEQMQLEGFSPDDFTFACVLKACCIVGALEKGKEVHKQIAKEHLLERNVVVASALVDMYAKCGALGEAQEVFNGLQTRDRVAWTALITGYMLYGHAEEALHCFEQMQIDAVSPNATTLSCIVKVCGSIGDLDMGQQVHAQIVRQGLLGKVAYIGTALIDMYAKCGHLAITQDIFDKLEVRDVATWTALITAYSQDHRNKEALYHFDLMQDEGFIPDEVTYACALKACGSFGALEKGQGLHGKVIKCGSVERDMVVGTALVDMYVNWGMLAEAQNVFDWMHVRDLVTWSVLMVGYAQSGQDGIVCKTLEDLIEDGKEPNVIIFTIVLNTCSHLGLLNKGQLLFDIFSKDYGLVPNLEQFTCMVDLFGRAGHLDTAVAMLEEMPCPANRTLLHTLMCACWTWRNTEFGRWTFDRAIELDENDIAAYICMSNMYAAAGRHHDAKKIDALRIDKGGHSNSIWWSEEMEIDHLFIDGDALEGIKGYMSA